MGKYSGLARDIVSLIGGKENVNSVTHCVTRLRFHLADESKADDEALKNMKGIVTVMHSAGQYQVVIGNHVPYVYEDVMEVLGVQSSHEDVEEETKGIFNTLIDIISGCFQPVLGCLCASGIIKGLNALLSFILGASFSASGTYLVLNAIGDALFYFLPVILGYASAKKFKVNPVVGMVIGAALCYPTIQSDALSAAGKALGTIPVVGSYYTTFMGIPLVAANYTSSVVPVLVVVAFASFIQKYAKKWIPEMLQNFFVPFFVLLISLPVGFLVIGPVISTLTDLLSKMFAAVYAFSPIASGFAVGFLWQILVVFGLHWAIIPLALLNIQTLGYDTILVGQFGTTFALTGAILAMYFKMKNKEKKTMVVPAIISGICGVTEPGIYGFALPEKTPFIISCLAAGVAGAIFNATGAQQYVIGGLGIFGTVSFISPKGDPTFMYYSFISIAVATILGFVLTYIFWKDKENVENQNGGTEVKKKETKEIIVSPMKGNIIPLKQVQDDAFAQGALGNGVGIQPVDGKVYAPVDGVVTTLFPTKHAIGITSNHGVEVLIHIGLNTVNLDGAGFEAQVKQGDTVKKGQLIMQVDLDKIEKTGYSVQTPIIITNSKDMLDIIPTQETKVNEKDTLITVLF